MIFGDIVWKFNFSIEKDELRVNYEKYGNIFCIVVIIYVKEIE